MPLRTARPVKRPTSSYVQFRKRIPSDVLPLARGRTITVPVGDTLVPLALGSNAETVMLSLRTRDPREAKARHGAVAAHLEGVWKGLRDGPQRLTAKQVQALAGEAYRAFVGRWGDDPGWPGIWTAYRAGNARARTEGKLEDRFGAAADFALGRHALTVDGDTRARLLDALADAEARAADRLAANAEGDYGPDANLSRFPKVEAKPTAAPAPSDVSLTDLLAGWWREGKARNLAISTYDSYASTVGKLRAFLRHDDAGRVTADDVLRFKNHRLETVAVNTVKNSDLAGLKAVFAWAVANRKLPANPAEGITLKAAKPVQTRSKGFTDEEARAILLASRGYNNPDESPQTVAAKRWIPWLMAYSGARVGEFAQLRKEDVRQEGGLWAVNITPDAGRVKDKKARLVALHPHLIEMGFVTFVHAASPGPLFLRPSPDGNTRGRWQGVKNRLQMFGREAVTDTRVKPNHGWRHRFKTVGREVGIGDALLDHITGHAPGTVGDAYGDYTVKAQHRALSMMPRYPET